MQDPLSHLTPNRLIRTCAPRRRTLVDVEDEAVIVDGEPVHVLQLAIRALLNRAGVT